MKKIIFTICTCLFSIPLIAQKSNLAEVDLQLSKLYNDLRFSDWEGKDTLVPKFTNLLYASLATPESFNYPFDSLSTKFSKVISPDNKINIWSWDQHTGGSWHQYISAVQFKTDDENIGFRQLNSGEEMMLGGYTDVYIYKIFEIENEGDIYYLTFGRGTHGSGSYHRLAQIFYIKGDELVKCEPCFEEENDLVLEARRGDEIILEFDTSKNEIKHTVLIEHEESGRNLATDKLQIWEFKNGNFIKTGKE